MSLGWTSKTAVDGLYAKLFSRVWEPSFHIPTAMYKGFGFSAFLPAFGVVTVFYFSLSSRCVLIARGGLICISLMANNTEHLLICHLHSNFCEVSVHVFCPFSNWIVVVFKFYHRVLWVFYTSSLLEIVVCKYFLLAYSNFFFILLMGSSINQTFLILMRLIDQFFSFMAYALDVKSKNSLPRPSFQRFSYTFCQNFYSFTFYT